jgi:hypothetical protein
MLVLDYGVTDWYGSICLKGEEISPGGAIGPLLTFFNDCQLVLRKVKSLFCVTSLWGTVNSFGGRKDHIIFVERNMQKFL